MMIIMVVEVQNISHDASKPGSDDIFSMFVDVFNLMVSSNLSDKSMIIGRYIKQYVNDIKVVIK